MFGILPFLWDWVSAPDYPIPVALTMTDASIEVTTAATAPAVTVEDNHVTFTVTVEDGS